MIILHVFLKNNHLVTNPKARPRWEYDWDRESTDLGTPGQCQTWTLPVHLLIVPETSPGGNDLGQTQGDLDYVSVVHDT